MPKLFLKKEKYPYHLDKAQYDKIFPVWQKWIEKKENSIIRLATEDFQASEIDHINRDDTTEEKGMRSYSKDELDNFEREQLKGFLKDGKLTLEAELEFYVSRFLLKTDPPFDSGKNLKALDYQWIVIRENVEHYQMARNLIEAWRDRSDRREYAKKKELEELESSTYGQELAEQLTEPLPEVSGDWEDTSPEW